MAISTDIERLNYYEGEYLGAVDFEAEQEYHRDMRRRHNVGQHTWGIVTGLDLALVPNGQTSGGLAVVDVYIQPGMAVDGFGREIVVLNQTQVTQDLFAAYYDPNQNATAQNMGVWITYAQQLIQPSQDACASLKTSNPFGRVQETFQIVVAPQTRGPSDDSLTIDGDTIDPATITPSAPPPTAPDGSILPPDLSIPYQQLPTEDTTVFWYIPLGQVLWNPNSGLLLNTTAAAKGRSYVGAVCSRIYAPAAQLVVEDRNSPYPPPASSTDPNLGGVGAEIAGSLQVDFLLNPLLSVLIGATYRPGNNPAVSPLTIVGTGTNEDLVQFRDPTGNPKWQICQNINGTSPGIDTREVATGKDRLFIQTTLTNSAPSQQNIGVGTLTPRNPLAIRAQGKWDELLSFEDSGGTTKWHLNRNPQGSTPQGSAYKPGLNFSETGVADFRFFLEEGGNVGMGTPLPEQNLSVNAGLNIDQADANGGAISPGLTFGSGSGEGIASNRAGGVNNDGLDFYTAFAARMSITQQGLVGIGVQAPQSLLHLAGGQWDLTNTEGDLKIGNPGMRLKIGVALGGAGAGDGRIRVQGGTNRLMIGTGADDTLTIVNGNVGIGTTAPALTLDVQGDFGRANGPATLHLDGSQIGDSGNGILSLSSGGTFIAFDGKDNVGFGINAPVEKLHVIGNIQLEQSGRILKLRTDGAAVDLQSDTSDVWIHSPLNKSVFINPNGGNVGIGTTTPNSTLDVNGGVLAATFSSPSDERFKTDIAPLTSVLEKLNKIRGLSYEWDEAYASPGRARGKRQIGVLAHEVETVFPELVITYGDKDYKALDYGRLTAVLIEAVKELAAQNQALSQKIEALEQGKVNPVKAQQKPPQKKRRGDSPTTSPSKAKETD